MKKENLIPFLFIIIPLLTNTILLTQSYRFSDLRESVYVGEIQHIQYSPNSNMPYTLLVYQKDYKAYKTIQVREPMILQVGDKYVFKEKTYRMKGETFCDAWAQHVGIWCSILFGLSLGLGTFYQLVNLGEINWSVEMIALSLCTLVYSFITIVVLLA